MLHLAVAAIAVAAVCVAPAAIAPTTARAARPAAIAAVSSVAITTTATTAATATSGATPTATPARTMTATAAATARPSSTARPSTTARPTATRRPAPVAAPAATLSVNPETIARGGVVLVSGAGYLPRETVFVYFASSPRAVTPAQADANGLLPATGVTVPYALGPGAHTVVALGTRSRRLGRVSVTVQALTPHISLDLTSVVPGRVVTVSGQGFGPAERVTLALNGAALTTTPAVITTTNGAFSAQFVVPGRLLSGDNTVSAVGNSSRVAVVQALTGSLPISAHFYFTGGLNTGSEHSFLAMLNPNGQPARVRLTFYFPDGTTASHTVEAVPPHAQQTVSVADYGLPMGTFGLTVEADRRITAQLNINRDGRDGDSLLGNSGLGTTWYLAEGYTGATFHESVSILNPDPAIPARVTLRLLPIGGQPGMSTVVDVPPHTNLVQSINNLLPNQSLSIIATSTRPVVVERTMTFSANSFGMTTRAGTNVAAANWLFAEGTTVNRFQTFLTILNPTGTPATVTASFFGTSGGSLGNRTIVVPPLRRANLKLNDFLSASGIASVLTSNVPIVVERPEYFGSPNDANVAGSDVFGSNGASSRWTFPGGSDLGSGKNVSEYLLLYNPSAQTVPITATFLGADGRTRVAHILVTPTVRYTLSVSDVAPGLMSAHGAVLQAPRAQGFVAEQTVFATDYSALRSTQGLAQ